MRLLPPLLLLLVVSLACSSPGRPRRGKETPAPAAPVAPAPAPASPDSELPPNVLVIVADDLGVDKVRAYGVHPQAPPTPNIDALAAKGVLFRNAYTYSICSPSRAALLTGRYGRRHGLGGIVELDEGTWEVPLDEV